MDDVSSVRPSTHLQRDSRPGSIPHLFHASENCEPLSAALVVGARAIQLPSSGAIRVTDPEAAITLRIGSAESGPTEFALAQNYPNPFNPRTTIRFDLPLDTRVSLKVFNVLGQEVNTLVNGDQKSGYKSIEWDASHVASGVYFYRLEAGNYTNVKKMLVLK